MIPHSFSFDPSHGYDITALLEVEAPAEPEGFTDFWNSCYESAMQVDPCSRMQDTGRRQDGLRVFDRSFATTGGVEIGGWALLPEESAVVRACLIGHGYGGRSAPDFDIPIEEAALFFPCVRGLGKSNHCAFSRFPQTHVLHDIHSRDSYILRGCVEDLWVATSALLSHFPETAGRVGFQGTSLTGGLGALALAWEQRLDRAHLHLPTFGNHPLRMTLPSTGSAAALQSQLKNTPTLMDTLAYYDAAVAARHIPGPVLCSCALMDPAVAPAGQFAIFNALPEPKDLFILSAGHHAYAAAEIEKEELCQKIYTFFRDM